MRILVTRPEEEAAATAARLAALGHTPVIAPLSVIIPTGAPLPEGPFAGVLATSAAAFAVAPPALAPLLSLPLHAVGEKTAAAARSAGFARILTGPGTAAALASLLAPATMPLLYLAGEPRKSDLELALAARSVPLVVCLRYRAEAAPALPPAAAEALRAGTLDVVLHYSRKAAERFCALAHAAGLAEAAGKPRHLCLSGDVAGGLAALGPVRIAIAERPDEPALFGQLDKES